MCGQGRFAPVEGEAAPIHFREKLDSEKIRVRKMRFRKIRKSGRDDWI
jgi:hypothetical protein